MASGTELLLCRVAAAPYPAYLSGSDCLLARQATAPPGDGIRHGAAFIPGAAAPYPAYSPKSPLAQGLLKLPVLVASTSLRRSRKAGSARMDAG
ncbi:hypothetical protein [Klebsiella pneumoniae]|uniref:hypothetical protein n=1 Tax=Klebsiella pneumoniae TaxID=573 RepID=UPI0011D21F23|nr:hypothetical protein [Klebsiella pneumoniae]